MLKPVPMMKVAVVGPKVLLGEATGALYEARLIHIEDYGANDPGFDLGAPLKEGAKVSERLLRVRGLLKSAQIEPAAKARPYSEEDLRKLEADLVRIEQELARLVEARNKILEESKRIREEQVVLNRVRNFPLDLRYLTGYRSLAIAAGLVDPRTDLTPLRRLGPASEVFESSEVEGHFVAVFAPRAQEKQLQETVARVGLRPVELPKREGTAAGLFEQNARRQAELSSEEAELEARIAAIRERHAAAFYALAEQLSIQADKATAPVRFRTTRNSFLIEGWVPREDYGRVQRVLRTQFADRVYVTEVGPTSQTAPNEREGEGHEHVVQHEEGAEVPVKLKNWNPSGPYELLTDTYARPKYRELDPTLFFYFGFPLFYGMMLGDIGYAALLLVMVWTGIFTRLFRFFGFESHWHLNKIILHSAVLSFLFGILYAEFFGLELFGHEGVLNHFESHLGPIPYPLSRFAEVKLLLLISLVLAAVHLFIGLLLGMRNATIAHGFGQALKHRGSWLLILLAVTLVGTAILPPVLGFGAPLPATMPILLTALVVFLAGVILLVLGEGAIAIMELPTILSNLLSYTRLVAIGLSSAGIALAGNEVSSLAFETGGGVGIALGLLLLLLFHGLNLALGIIGPAVHSLRLHYVEFFTKFYEGGGIIYAPFGSERKFTTKEVRQA